MRNSPENNRQSVPDHPELALTTAQKITFANWEAGFEAHARGIPLDGHPHSSHWAHKVRKIWQEGWNASASLEKIKSEWLLPLHLQQA